MATPREVINKLKKFTQQIERANGEIEEVLKLIRELEKDLETYNADEDLEITRGMKSEINRGKKKITELKKTVNKLEKELSDTNRKYHYLST